MKLVKKETPMFTIYEVRVEPGRLIFGLGKDFSTRRKANRERERLAKRDSDSIMYDSNGNVVAAGWQKGY